LGLIAGALAAVALYAKQPLTAEAAFETARIIKNPWAIAPGNVQGAVAISPDGRRYVARVARGDVARNGVWVEVVSGQLIPFDSTARSRTVARLFTRGVGSADSVFGSTLDTMANLNPLRWLDNGHIAFLHSNEQGIRQVVRIDLSVDKVEYLTQHPTHVNAFDIASHGLVMYNAQAQLKRGASTQMLRKGYVVPREADPESLFNRDLNGGNIFDKAWGTEWFIQDGPRASPRRFKIAGRELDIDYRHRIDLSPDGKWALVDSAAVQIPVSWDRYTDSQMRVWIAEARRDPRAAMSRGIHQLFLVDLAQGATRPLWNSPGLIWISRVAWSPDGKSVLLGPAYLPVEVADERGLAGEAVVVLQIATARYEQLPVALSARSMPLLRWLSGDEVEIVEPVGAAPRRFKKTNGQWQALGAGELQSSIRIELRESLDAPPKVFAVEASTGREQALFDPNPRLQKDFHWGRSESIGGALDGGFQWTGLLFYPAHYRRSRHYPLIIQSVYASEPSSQFTLYGFQESYGVGPTPVAAAAGRLLADRGMFVLTLDIIAGSQKGTSAEGETRQKVFEAAAERLIASGVIDRSKVGLAGFSRNGYWVEYALSHSSFPFAAAIAADNADPSYFQTTIGGYGSEADEVNGGAPFGAGLAAWLEKAPGFGAERIQTPLRIVGQSQGVFGVFLNWEVFSRLRYLNKPVEFYVMPDAEEHGSHAPQSPGQVIPVQQGAVDWFDFWLNGAEDVDPGKVEQYVRWRQLRAQQSQALKQPRPPALKWTATPVEPSVSAEYLGP
jgi:hypothetical protein